MIGEGKATPCREIYVLVFPVCLLLSVCSLAHSSDCDDAMKLNGMEWNSIVRF